MDLPEKVADFDSQRIVGLFKSFLDREVEFQFVDGLLVRPDRKMSAQIIIDFLHITRPEAELVLKGLIVEGYLDPEKLVPTRRGMALSQISDRPKISRAEAEEILESVLVWADHVNADADARVKLKSIHLFGSLERGQPMVGDIDLFVEFTTLDLANDLQPEDQDREDELSDELVEISEYLSPSDALQREMMSDVPMRRIFPRV
ncbi:hypothetical protein [Agrobacterium deltaense]|uniref:hypothetical protein n=1 Tax=Agrobacterium deltaense TaxID=1183412 RepID=UPI001C6E8636|nr:hypothetical protein [Agrobacterium deltaense]MBW9076061.1 hypothetical protein [Agrobacterium deltaense]